METLNIIKSLLEKNNLTQKSLTDYLGINKNAFTNWLNGNNTSYIKHLPQIAEFFNVSTDYLLGRENKSEEKILTYGNSKKDELKRKIDSIDLTDEKIDLLLSMIDSWI